MENNQICNSHNNGYTNGYNSHRKEVCILLVEDDPDHVELTMNALKENGIGSMIHVAGDGEEALRYIYDSVSAKPDLILLDIRLPRIDGFEVLKRIKADPDLQSIPVVLLTTSSEDGDVIQGYKFGANSYVTKPVRFKNYVEKIKNIKSYWICTNTLPVT